MPAELIYHYYWKHRMPYGEPLTLVDGSPLHIITPGIPNTDQGPDFHNAKIRIGDRQLRGDVEIHVNASDWHRHHHDADPRYAQIILHVVANDDARIHLPGGQEIPQLRLDIPDAFREAYALFTQQQPTDIRCRDYAALIPQLLRRDWTESLYIERLQTKALRIAHYYRQSGQDWRQALFAALARALGFGLNAEPMETLALSLPIKTAEHHADNPLQLEALLFGQAGALSPLHHRDNPYYQQLRREYDFLMRKYSLSPPWGLQFKNARTRPQNSWQRRIALLAATLRDNFPLYRALVDNPYDDLDALRPLLDAQTNQWWRTHTSFDPASADTAPYGALATPSFHLILINAVAPFLYAYGTMRDDERCVNRALSIWEQLPPERNRFIRLWEALGIRPENALESQAIIQLHKCYCQADRCLECRFGNHLLRLTTGFVPHSQIDQAKTNAATGA